MLTDQEFTELLEDLASQDPSFRAVTLEVLWQFPSADARVLPYLERMLHDKAPCILGIPYVFGEIRWLAAYALATERAALGITEPVRLQNVVRPAETMDIMRAADAADFDLRGGVEGLLADLAILRDMGYMPMIDLNLLPAVSKNGAAAPAASQTSHQPELVPA